MNTRIVSITLAAICGLSTAALGGCGGGDNGPAAGAPAGAMAAIAAQTSPGPGQAAFLVTRAGDTSADLPVAIGASDAGAAGDYSIPASVTVPAGSASASVTVTRTADGRFEGPRAVTVSILAGAGYSVGAAGSALASMADADLPQVAGTYSGQFSPVSGIASGRSSGGGGSFSLLGLAVVPGPSLFLAASDVNWTVELVQSGGTVSGRYVDDRGFTGSVTGTVDGNGALSMTVAVDGAPAGSTASGTIAISATVLPDAGAAAGAIAAGTSTVVQGFTVTTGGTSTPNSGEAPSTMAGAGTADGTPARPSAANPLGFWNYDGNDLQVSPRQVAWINGGYQRLDAWGQAVPNSSVSVSGTQVTMWRDQGPAYSPASQRYLRDVWALSGDGRSMTAVSRTAGADGVTFSDLSPLYAGALLRVDGDPWTALPVAAAGITVDGNSGDWPADGPINSDPAGDQGSGGNASSDILGLWACENHANSVLGVFLSASGNVSDAPAGMNWAVDVSKQNGTTFTLFVGHGSMPAGSTSPASLSGANIKDGSGTIVLNNVPAWTAGDNRIETTLPFSTLGIASGSKVLMRVRTQANGGSTTYDRTRAVPVRLP